MDVLNVNPFCLVRYGACARVRYFLLSTYVECGRQPGVNKCDLATRCRCVQRSAEVNPPGLVTFVPACSVHATRGIDFSRSLQVGRRGRKRRRQSCGLLFLEGPFSHCCGEKLLSCQPFNERVATLFFTMLKSTSDFWSASLTQN